MFTFFKIPQIQRTNEVQIKNWQIQSILTKAGVNNCIITDTIKGLLPASVYREVTQLSYVYHRQYIAEKFDCEDFSAVMYGTFTELIPNACFGLIHVQRIAEKDTHCVVFFIDDQKEIWYIEPQTNVVFQTNNYKPYFAYC